MGWRFLRVWSITNKSRQCHSLGEMMRRHSPWRVPTNESLKHSNLSSSSAVSCSSSIWVCQGARFLEPLATRPYSLDQSAHHQISLRPHPSSNHTRRAITDPATNLPCQHQYRWILILVKGPQVNYDLRQISCPAGQKSYSVCRLNYVQCVCNDVSADLKIDI